MNQSKPYAALPVHRIVLSQLTPGRPGLDVVVGCDLGTFEIRAVPRWGSADCGRPWRVLNPQQVPDLVRLLLQLAQGRRRRLALEPSGTYGDVVRPALHDAGRPVRRVSPKAAHDYAAICDGVPSQHEGTDAAGVAA
jgi:hypothetical protein